MASVRYFICISLLCFIGIAGLSQTKQLDFFLSEGMKKSPAILEINNLQQNFDIQNQFITAQNKRPLISFTGDYLFAPFFFDDGKPISITSNPSPKAYGYDVGITNGGLYAAQLNASLPIFNTAIVKRLYEQNKVQADISANTRKQIEHELAKTITDQYIVTYQFQLQAVYLQKIIDQLENRKPLVAALVKQGLLQQNDYLLLDIQLSTNKNDLKQLEFAYNNGIALLKNLAFISDTTTFLLDKPNLIIDTATPDYYYVQKYKLDSLNLVAQLNVTNTKYLPQVSLMGSTGLNGTELTRLPHNVGLSAAVHVSIPISDGHQRKLYQRQNAIL
ncbi:MAG: TolC family protein, partial [Ferruginibacter sp.]